jgi:NAD(P)-dependent dehydrogenase (short-subunit alcohol dehydrogenase family)
MLDGVQGTWVHRAMRLVGEQVLVTGSTSGIGDRVPSSARAKARASRYTVATSSAEPAVVRAITDAGGTAVFIPADVADESACRRLVDEAANPARWAHRSREQRRRGSGGDSPVGGFDTARWERVLRVNLTAVAWLCRAAIPHMLRAGHGSIVNVSSRQASARAPGSRRTSRARAA